MTIRKRRASGSIRTAAALICGLLAAVAGLPAAALPLAGTPPTIRLPGRSTKAERAAVEALLAPGGTLVAV